MSVAQIDNLILDELREHFDSRCFSKDQEVIYKGHIPFYGLVLIDGEIQLCKGRSCSILGPGSVVGIRELVQNTPLNFDVVVKAGSTVCVFDRSTIKEMALGLSDISAKAVGHLRSLF